MGEPKPNNSRTWVTVTIAVALISCIGVIVAAVIEGLFDVVIISQTPQPPSTVVLTEPPPSNSSSPSDVGETNTGEKLPTKTVVPSDTDTLSGTILDIGQTWRQGGLELRLDKAEVTIGDEYRDTTNHNHFCHFYKRPTARVTCAGADGGRPSDEKKAEAWKMPKKRADSPASSARIVGRRLTWQANYL